MYYLNGIDSIIKNIRQACGVSNTCDLSSRELKNAYHVFLNKESAFEIPINWDSIEFTDFPGLVSIAPSFCARKKEFFALNSSLLSERLSSDFFTNGLLKLKKQNHELFNLAQFVIKIILINQLGSYTNGTTHETIGLSSMDFKDEFEEQDFVELVVHQLTHMILFIDDHCNTHMLSGNKEIMIDTTLKYKLGGNQFPAYIAFHSYIVGVEVLCFRESATGFEYNSVYHGSTERIIRVCTQFQNALINAKYLFTDKGQAILEKATKLFSEKSLQYQLVNAG